MPVALLSKKRVSLTTTELLHVCMPPPTLAVLPVIVHRATCHTPPPPICTAPPSVAALLPLKMQSVSWPDPPNRYTPPP